jgi:hypothetical protein
VNRGSTVLLNGFSFSILILFVLLISCVFSIDIFFVKWLLFTSLKMVERKKTWKVHLVMQTMPHLNMRIISLEYVNLYFT